MARIRSVKPEAWRDPKVGGVSVGARLLWVVLLTMADDEGRFEALPMIVVGHGYPRDEGALTDVPVLLRELSDSGLIVLYQVDGEPYGYHPRWKDHQKINRPSPARFPAPPEPSLSDHAPLSEGSQREGKGREGRGEEGTAGERADVPAVAGVPDHVARLLPLVAAGKLVDPRTDGSDLALLDASTEHGDRLVSAALDHIVSWATGDGLANKSVRRLLPTALEKARSGAKPAGSRWPAASPGQPRKPKYDANAIRSAA